jgi:hypothetical protein
MWIGIAWQSLDDHWFMALHDFILQPTCESIYVFVQHCAAFTYHLWDLRWWFKHGKQQA